MKAVGRLAIFGTVARLAVAIPTAPLSAQSASDIVERMLSEYARRAEGVENYTLIQDAMGFETISYFVKEMDEGRPVFRLQRTLAGGMDASGDGDGSLDEISSKGDEPEARAVYVGVRRAHPSDSHTP